MSEPSRRELLNVVYKLDLYSFVQRSFGVLEPGNRFMPAAYLELLCAALMQVDARAVKRLIINMPPRHLKSFVTSVVFPAWLLMRDPKTKIAVICHSDMLANDLASKCKRLIESDDYRQIAPQVQIRQDRDRRMDFETTRGGGVYFTSIASGITGRGFDHIILDDPIAANDAQSAAERDRVQQAFDDMISSRLDEPARGTITVVQQRLHEADLSGYLLSKGGWDILCLPLVAEEEKTYKFGNYEWRRPVGDVLLPERFPEAEIQKIRANNGETIFATQWQQNPTSTRGELIKPEYLIPIDACPPGATRIFIAVDTAVKQTATSAYTVFLVIATDGTRHYVVDVLRARFDPVEMCDAVVATPSKVSRREGIDRRFCVWPWIACDAGRKGIEIRAPARRRPQQGRASRETSPFFCRWQDLRSQKPAVDRRLPQRARSISRRAVRRPGRCVDLVSRVHVFQGSDSTLHLVGKQLGRADGPRDGRSALAQRRAPHAAAGA